MGRRRPLAQMDLLAWEPPQPVIRFDELTVRAATVQARITRERYVSLVLHAPHRSAGFHEAVVE